MGGHFATRRDLGRIVFVRESALRKNATYKVLDRFPIMRDMCFVILEDAKKNHIGVYVPEYDLPTGLYHKWVQVSNDGKSLEPVYSEDSVQSSV